MEQLINDLKLQIKEALNLEELSVDVLEIIVLLEKKYGIRLANPKEGKAIFHSIRTIAEYVQANRKK